MRSNMKTRLLLHLLLAIFCFNSQPVAANSWRDAIEQAELTSGQYYQAASRAGYGAGYLGTFMNELGISEHTCSILGRMLGKEETTTELEFIEKPDLGGSITNDNFYDYLIAARLFENWASTAIRMLELSESEKVSVWNLSCVGSFEISEDHYIGEVSTTFVVDDNELRVLGDIESGFYEELVSVLSKNPDIDEVLLGSGGGSVSDAIRSGRLLRQRQISTSLYSDCLSACPLVFLGGSPRRIIWSPYPRLGFHQVSRGGQPVQTNNPIYTLIAEYVDSMGANPRFVMSWVFEASIYDMHYPNVSALCQYGVTTWVQRAC